MADDRPVGTEYAGPSRIGSDSPWLTWEDLPEGKDVTVTIQRVLIYARVKFEQGRTRDNMLGLDVGSKTKRVLGLTSATNRKTLVKMFGDDTKAWKGQKITLFVTTTMVGGEERNCIRIRQGEARAPGSAGAFLKQPAAAGTTVPSEGVRTDGRAETDNSASRDTESSPPVRE